MEIPIHHIGAFVTDGVFTGNPAAVCPLREWLPDDVMQKIAAENNLSETAFFVGGNGRYQIRWMTPSTEIDLSQPAERLDLDPAVAKALGRAPVEHDQNLMPAAPRGR